MMSKKGEKRKGGGRKGINGDGKRKRKKKRRVREAKKKAVWKRKGS